MRKSSRSRRGGGARARRGGGASIRVCECWWGRARLGLAGRDGGGSLSRSVRVSGEARTSWWPEHAVAAAASNTRWARMHNRSASSSDAVQDSRRRWDRASEMAVSGGFQQNVDAVYKPFHVQR